MISLLLVMMCAISASLISYGMLTPELWKNGHYFKIVEPSVCDLEDTSNEYIIHRYEKEEVKKYYDYLSLKKQIEKFMLSDFENLLIFSFPLVFWFIISKSIMYDFPDLSAFWIIIISIAITGLITVLPIFVIGKIFPVSTFDVEDTIAQYKSIDSPQDLHVTERADMNNFLISRHHWFLFCIYKKEYTRYGIRIVGYVLTAVAFVTMLFVC